MQRRLMKALEDLTVQYDTTVRNSAGHMIQVRARDGRTKTGEMVGGQEKTDKRKMKLGVADIAHGTRQADVNIKCSEVFD